MTRRQEDLMCKLMWHQMKGLVGCMIGIAKCECGSLSINMALLNISVILTICISY